jgi:hypothetical protein
MVFTLRRYFRPDGSTDADHFLEHIADPAEAYAAVLPPRAATIPPLEVNPVDRQKHASSIDFAAVTFTDAGGRRWWRFGRGEPKLATPQWTIHST